MGFFNRLTDILSANINDLLDRMEDPEKMMKQLVREMEDAVQRAKGELVKAIAHERRVEKEMAGHKRKAGEWHSKAVEAVKKDRDDLARKAIELQKESEAILAALEPELAAAHAAAEAMRKQMKALQAKTAEARRKQAALGARSKAADMAKSAAGGSGKVDASAFGEFERMAQSIDQAEAEAEAVTEVASSERVVEDEFAEWESGGEVTAELEKLKKKVKGA